MTVFEREELDRLTQDTGSLDFALSFVRTYLAMLDTRLDRIIDALVARDVDAALDATLSLKVSCATTGAAELSALARAIEVCLRREDLTGSHEQVRLLSPAAERARTAITSYVDTGLGDRVGVGCS